LLDSLLQEIPFWSSHSNGGLVGQTPGDVCGDVDDGDELLG